MTVLSDSFQPKNKVDMFQVRPAARKQTMQLYMYFLRLQPFGKSRKWCDSVPVASNRVFHSQYFVLHVFSSSCFLLPVTVLFFIFFIFHVIVM